MEIRRRPFKRDSSSFIGASARFAVAGGGCDGPAQVVDRFAGEHAREEEEEKRSPRHTQIYITWE